MLLGWTALSVANPPPSAPPPAQLAAPLYFYTLQIAQESDLATLEKSVGSFSRLVTFRSRIVKEGDSYAIRIGKSLHSDELEALVPSLKSVGFWTAGVLYLETDKEEVVYTINPELPESINQPQFQTHLLQARQDKLPVVSRRMTELFPREAELSRLARLNKSMDKDLPEEGDALISRAWEAYRHGSLTTACELFERAQNLPEARREALRGLAHCFLQIGNYQEAIDLFTWLIQKGEEPEQNRTRLVESLFKAGKLESALEEAHHLDEAQALQWRRLISKRQQEIETARIRKRYDPEKPEEFVQKYRDYLDRCLLTETFLTAAKDMAPSKNETAARLYNQLLDACDGRWDVRLSAYLGLMQILPTETMRHRIGQELERINLPSGYREKLLAGLEQSPPSKTIVP